MTNDCGYTINIHTRDETPITAKVHKGYRWLNIGGVSIFFTPETAERAITAIRALYPLEADLAIEVREPVDGEAF